MLSEKQENKYEISPSIVALDEISVKISTLLKEWDFPNSDRVYFDESAKVKDFVIEGKPRGSFGKGSRAVLHAAFSIALLEYCHSQNLPHPGFLVLDSPLLAYYKPEGADDIMIKGSQLKERFYRYLTKLPNSMQFIIIENPHPPEDIEQSVPVTVFSANPSEGRYGLFPPRNQDL
jgi:hypothetical protein